MTEKYYLFHLAPINCGDDPVEAWSAALEGMVMESDIPEYDEFDTEQQAFDAMNELSVKANALLTRLFNRYPVSESELLDDITTFLADISVR